MSTTMVKEATALRQLTAKQQRFVDEYLIDCNATQAAIRAGYSAKTAMEQAYQLVRKTSVAQAIEKKLEKREKKSDITAERVLTEIARLAFLDPRKAFDSNGALLQIHQMPDEIAASVASIEVEEVRVKDAVVGLTKKVKFWDKGRALEQLCKHLGITKDKVELTGKDGGAIEVDIISDEDREARLQSLLKTIEARVTDTVEVANTNAVHPPTNPQALVGSDSSGEGGA